MAYDGCARIRGDIRLYRRQDGLSGHGCHLLQGAACSKGTIAFAGEDETTFIAGGDIVDGRYSVDVTPGTYRITIDTPEPARMPGPPPPGLNIPPEVIKRLTDEARAAALEKRVLVPKRYGQYDTSPLRYTVTRGPQAHDVTITEE